MFIRTRKVMSKKNKFTFKGKQVLLLGLVALVITAGYYRWNVESDKYTSIPVTGDVLPVNNEAEKEENTDNTSKSDDNVHNGAESVSGKFAKLRQERDKARGDAAEQWKQTAQSKEASQETKSDAEKKVKKSNEYAEKEASIETLVKAKGYDDCFALLDETGISVTITGGEVNGAKIAQIKDIIISETNIDAKKIKISAE